MRLFGKKAQAGEGAGSEERLAALERRQGASELRWLALADGVSLPDPLDRTGELLAAVEPLDPEALYRDPRGRRGVLLWLASAVEAGAVTFEGGRVFLSEEQRHEHEQRLQREREAEAEQFARLRRQVNERKWAEEQEHKARQAPTPKQRTAAEQAGCEPWQEDSLFEVTVSAERGVLVRCMSCGASEPLGQEGAPGRKLEHKPDCYVMFRRDMEAGALAPGA